MEKCGKSALNFLKINIFEKLLFYNEDVNNTLQTSPKPLPMGKFGLSYAQKRKFSAYSLKIPKNSQFSLFEPAPCQEIYFNYLKTNCYTVIDGV